MKKKISFIKFFILICICVTNIIFSKSIFSSDKKNNINNIKIQQNLSPIIKKILPSVVRIITDFDNLYHGYYYDDSLNQKKIDYLSNSQNNILKYESNFYKQPILKKIINEKICEDDCNSKLGSGVIIDSKNSYVLTNYHVISNASKIEVILDDGKEYEAYMIGKNKKIDLALLKLIDAENLQSIEIDNSTNVNIGDPVFAIGSPYNLNNSVTLGIVSSLNRIIDTNNVFDNFIQTDAAINHGNSGGPLFNLEGKLIGINTSMLSSNPESGNIGLGFSIPSRIIVRFINDILKYGDIHLSSLGISASNLSKDMIFQLALPLDKEAIIVNKIYKNSSAEEAGLKIGDIITSLNSKDVTDSILFKRELVNFLPNDSIFLKVFRNNRYYNISAKLHDYKRNILYAGKFHYKLQGALISEYDKEKLSNDMKNHKIKKFVLPSVNGIIINKFLDKSFSKRSGLLENDIITSVNMTPVKDIQTFKDALLINEDIIILEIMRNNKLIFKIIS
ncbi:trypsin-like peptidase domain-containing protein [Buchnera aphidicola (Periphyllus koelreuteriae)]|uniref:trypsin-like peptidase domain-containing protein n=1 Tax=Buchnera aphidicola TaxID=9 RepID=UPI0031B7FC6F